MADNYLEKRYAEVFGGAAKAASHRPSLDVLLSRLGAPADPDLSYAIHQRQLDTLVSVNKHLDASQRLVFSTEVTDGPGRIVISSASESADEIMLAVGASVQCMALKAAEMGLRTKAVPAAEGQLYALEVFKVK